MQYQSECLSALKSEANIHKPFEKAFMVSMNAFSKGLCIFATDLRADMHSDWYCIRSVSLVIIRRVQRLLIY